MANDERERFGSSQRPKYGAKLAPQSVQWRPVAFLLKLAVSSGLIAWILVEEDLGAIGGVIRRVDVVSMLGAFLVYCLTYLVRAQRWRLLLEANSVHASIPFLIRSYLVSVFFSNFLPSTVGGDVVRVYDSWKAGATKTAALTVVFVDRFLGVAALLIFALAALLTRPAAAANAGVMTGAVLAISAAVVVGIWFLFFPASTVVGLMERLRGKAPPPLRRLADPLHATLHAFRGQPRLFAVTLTQSLFFQAMIILHYVLIARALGMVVPAVDFFWIVPIAILVMMLPVSINAIGVREHVFVLFFAGYGIAGAIAVAFAWASYAVVLVLGLVGGLVYLLRK